MGSSGVSFQNKHPFF